MHTASKDLSKQRRLTRPHEYRQVFGNARKHGGHGFTALVRANDLGRARLGLVISKKCSKKAVLRNRIKRMVRESFRLTHDVLGSYDIIIIGQPGIEKKSSYQLRADLSRIWKDICQYRKYS